MLGVACVSPPPLSLGLLTPPGCSLLIGVFDWKPWPSLPRHRLLIRLTPHHLISIKTRLERTQHKGPSWATVLLRASSRSFVRAVPCLGLSEAKSVGGDFFFLPCAPRILVLSVTKPGFLKKDGSQQLVRFSFMCKLLEHRAGAATFCWQLLLLKTHGRWTKPRHGPFLVRHDTRRRWKPLRQLW